MPAKVYDFTSRKLIRSPQDAVENAKDIPGGKYIGNIGENNAKAFQSTMTVLESVIERFIEVEAELMELSTMHEANVEYVLELLGVVSLFDEETDDLMVSENGHVWIVKAKEDEDDGTE